MSSDRYDREDFERYLKGQMTQEERYDFERKLLDDPFALEAIDGLESIDESDLSKDLKKIEKRIKGDEPTFNWIKIAAAVALLVVSSLAVFIIINPIQEPQEVALQTVPEKEEPSKEDEERLETTENIVDKKKDLNEVEAKKKVEPTSSPRSDEVSKPAKTATLAKADVDRIASPVVEDEADDYDLGEAELVLESEQAEYFADDAIDVTEAPVVPIEAGEQVVAKREKKAVSRASRFAELGATSPNNAAQPKIGMGNYNRYLADSLRYPPQALENQIEGVVKLYFTISELGEISNIEVRKSLGFGCDEEAIRLLEQGPSWNPASLNGKAAESSFAVDVEFVLNE